MRIAFDVDGVLRDFLGEVNRVYLTVFPDHEIIDTRKYDLAGRYPIGKEIGDFVFSEHVDEIFTNAPLLFDDAVHLFEKLKKDGHTVGVITVQNKKSLPATLIWLGKHKFCPDFVFCARFDGCAGRHVSKAGFDADILIDDKLENLVEWRDGGKTAICLRQPWNREWDGLTAMDTEDIYNIIRFIIK